MPRQRTKVFHRFLIVALLCTLSVWWYQESTIFQSKCLDMISPTFVPRGQAFFHTYPESNRFISCDTWRGQDHYHKSPLTRRSKQTNHGAHTNRILLLVKTSIQTAWRYVPVHISTTFTQFPNTIVFSDGADSIGDTEIVDALAHLPSDLISGSPQLEAYRKHRALRDKHVYISPDQIHIPGDHTLDKFKTLPMLYQAYKEAPDLDWYVLIDDDTSMLAKNLGNFLSQLDPNEHYYLGSAVAGLEHVFAHGGSGVVLSRGLMATAFGNPHSEDWVREYSWWAERECCGDYMIGLFLKERLGISLDIKTSDGHFQGNAVWATPVSSKNWCSEILSLSQGSPRDIQLLWEYQTIKNTPIVFSDLYLDFMKPYLPGSPEKNWDNFAKDIEYSPMTSAGESSHSPHLSLDNCRASCIGKPNCLMYRYDPYKRYCGLGMSTVTLGRPITHYTDGTNQELCEKYSLRCEPRHRNEPVTSEWLIERIQAMRRTASCDPLHADAGSEGATHGILDQVEGWWFRALQKQK